MMPPRTFEFMKCFLCLLLASLTLLPAAEPALVLILSGHSNTEGYGKATELSDDGCMPPANVSLIHE
jgi:hypothetical protein